MLRGFAVLLLFQLAGESLVFLGGIKVPGPVIGLVLLALTLGALGRFPTVRQPVEDAGEALLGQLGLFFVPAGVGVVALWPVIGGQAAAIGAVLVASALVTLLATVWTFGFVRRLQRSSGR